MTDTTLTLSSFLLARIAEDETAAMQADGWESRVTVTPRQSGEHYSRHDPARVLAECEAKRRIVELHRGFGLEDYPTVAASCDECGMDSPCPTLRILATVYADHPDYREEWRP